MEYPMELDDDFEVPEDAVVVGEDADGDTIYAGCAYHEDHWIPASVIPEKNTAYISYEGDEIEKSACILIAGEDYRWVEASNGDVPQGAVLGGTQLDGELLHVGRARVGGSLATGKICPSHNCIYIPFDGREHSFRQYEVLVYDNEGYTISEAAIELDGEFQLPEDAVVVGEDIDGDIIYAGCAYHEDHWIPAKVIPAKKVAYVAWGGREFAKSECRLITGDGFRWVEASNGDVPEGAVLGGTELDVDNLYIGRARVGGSIATGKINRSHNCIYVPFDGREHSFRQYEVLIQGNAPSLTRNAQADAQAEETSQNDDAVDNYSADTPHCRVCYRNYVDPMLLPCRHVFCKSCTRRVNSCPICRSQFGHGQCIVIYL